MWVFDSPFTLAVLVDKGHDFLKFTYSPISFKAILMPAFQDSALLHHHYDFKE